jgi:hypothetical protein
MTALTAGARAAVMAPDAAPVSGNLVAWYTDPANLYNAATGVWTDSSGQTNDTSTPGSDGPLGLATGQAISDGGLLSGKTIDYAQSTSSADTIGAQLNNGTPLGQFTVIALMDYGAANSNNRVGFGSYRQGDTADNFNLAGDGSIRKDNGSVGGGGSVPNEFLVRAVSFSGGTYDDYYIRAGGTTVNKSGGSFGTTEPSTDDFYMGDLRSNRSGDRFAQVAVYDTNLGRTTIEDISDWMALKPNGTGGPVVPGPAAFRTLNTANVIEDPSNNATFAVEVDGADIRIFDNNPGGGAARLSTETISADSNQILNYQVDFVHTSENTSGTGNMEFLRIGDGANDFAIVAINRSGGTDRFGTSNGGNTNLANPFDLIEGAEYGVSIFLNNSGQGLGYTDPLGEVQFLADDMYDVWFGPASGALGLLGDGIAAVGGASVGDLDTVKYQMRSVNAIQFETVWSPASTPVIPEPVALLIWSLLVGLGVGLGWRRR